MQGDIDGDEVGGVVVLGHVSSKAGLWEAVQLEQFEDPGDTELLVSYEKRRLAELGVFARQIPTFSKLEDL
jgi:hypothetical protein